MSNRLILNSILLGIAFFSLATLAERPSYPNAAGFISQGAAPGLAASGAVYLPSSVLYALQGGQLSAPLQYSLVNNMITKCTAEIAAAYPQRRDSYRTATAKFNDGLCRIQKCYQNAMMAALLGQFGSITKNLGAADSTMKAAASQAAIAYANAFKKSPACGGGTANDGGIDPAFLTLLGVR